MLPLYGADELSRHSFADVPNQSEEAPQLGASRHLEAGSNDWRIANITSQALEHRQYLQMPFDAKVSSKFFDMYINTLDPQHIHFLQSDVDEFEHYRMHLGDMIRRGDTGPAYVIFNRLMQRIQEQAVYVTELLADDSFDFTNTVRVLLNRKNASRPKDMAEAHQIWLDRVRSEYLQEKLNKESPEELGRMMLTRHTPEEYATTMRDFRKDIIKVISRRYARTLRNWREWESDKVLETYLTSLAHVYDPHSDYYDKADMENFAISMSLQLFGVGAELTIDDDGYCKINKLTPGGPAINSKKLKANDRIVAVAQGDHEPVDVVDMPLTKTVDLIRGPKGTEVRLTVIPADAVDPSTRVTVSLVRDKIKLQDQRAKADLIALPGSNGQSTRLGVIDLSSFYSSGPLMGDGNQSEAISTTQDVDKLLTKLKKEHVDGIILDLRHNGGGSLEEAINLTGLFIKEGPVVQIKDPGPNGEIRVESDRDPRVQYDGPLIVLTSRLSASASEILAGALQDYGRALLVGDASTHGKGTVQSLDYLTNFLQRAALNSLAPDDQASLGALKLTTRKFYRASGSSTQLKGVVPDIILPSVLDYYPEVGESSLENPLPWDTIDSANYDKVNRVQPYLPELERRSAHRVGEDKDYAYVREDIEKIKKAVADKTVSLNEQQRLTEKESDDVRARTREQELKSRKHTDETIYPITLKDADRPGLPAPLKRNIVADNNTSSSTNSPASATSAGHGSAASDIIAAADADDSNPKATDPDDAPPEDRAPLEEAEHILVDYISLMHSGVGVTSSDHAVNN
jgi:carboxyl-terminal processing protease